ncbi:MAG: glycosyltransferase family 2 protein [bacterium]
MHEELKSEYPEGITIVLPAYNEEENIEKAMQSSLKMAEKVAEHYEVIVVDDGSTDSTGEICEDLSRQNRHLKVIRHKSNQGYGAALRNGFTSAQYKLVFYTDADNQFDISELRYLLRLMDTYDVVTGFRVYRYDSPLRIFLSWVYNKLVKQIFGVKTRDIDCAFKVFRRKIFDQFTIESNDFFVDTEIMVKAKRLGYAINEVGVRHYPRMAGRTTVRPSDIPRTLRRMLNIWISARRLKPRQYGKKNLNQANFSNNGDNGTHFS